MINIKKKNFKNLWHTKEDFSFQKISDLEELKEKRKK